MLKGLIGNLRALSGSLKALTMLWKLRQELRYSNNKFLSICPIPNFPTLHNCYTTHWNQIPKLNYNLTPLTLFLNIIQNHAKPFFLLPHMEYYTFFSILVVSGFFCNYHVYLYSIDKNMLFLTTITPHQSPMYVVRRRRR